MLIPRPKQLVHRPLTRPTTHTTQRAEHNDGLLSTLEEVALHQLGLTRIERLGRLCPKLKILYLQNNLISRLEGLHKLKVPVVVCCRSARAPCTRAPHTIITPAHAHVTQNPHNTRQQQYTHTHTHTSNSTSST